jgi:hypothetical protein
MVSKHDNPLPVPCTYLYISAMALGTRVNVTDDSIADTKFSIFHGMFRYFLITNDTNGTSYDTLSVKCHLAQKLQG